MIKANAATLAAAEAVRSEVAIERTSSGPVPTWSAEPHWTEEERAFLLAGEPEHGPAQDARIASPPRSGPGST